jgi:hypothetical protein
MSTRLDNTVRWLHNSADRLTRYMAIPRDKKDRLWLYFLRKEARFHFRKSLSLLWQVYIRRKPKPR